LKAKREKGEKAKGLAETSALSSGAAGAATLEFPHGSRSTVGWNVHEVRQGRSCLFAQPL
jgi:hypothetical protein